jgi:DNA-binding Lrp family transcriptional regulator
MNNRKLRLDHIDIHILSLLQDKGRITNVDIADKVGISAPPCLRRVKSLEDVGYIKGYHAVLNHEALGYNVIVFSHVKLHSHSDTDLSAFQDLIQTWEEVRECYMLAGDTDFLLKIVAEDWDAYQRFLTTKLTQAANVAHVKSSLAIRQNKNAPGIPLKIPQR